MDLAIVWDAASFRGDWSVTPGDLQVAGTDVETAVLLSLFTDRVASTDYIAPAGSPQDRHGWWADTYEAQLGNPPIGSRLWQLNRAKKTDGTMLLAQARDYCLESLQWLVDSGVAASINVQTWWLTKDTIGISIVVAQPQSPPQTFNYAWAWTLNVAS